MFFWGGREGGEWERVKEEELTCFCFLFVEERGGGGEFFG